MCDCSTPIGQADDATRDLQTGAFSRAGSRNTSGYRRSQTFEGLHITFEHLWSKFQSAKEAVETDNKLDVRSAAAMEHAPRTSTSIRPEMPSPHPAPSPSDSIHTLFTLSTRPRTTPGDPSIAHRRQTAASGKHVRFVSDRKQHIFFPGGATVATSMSELDERSDESSSAPLDGAGPGAEGSDGVATMTSGAESTGGGGPNTGSGYPKSDSKT